MLVSQCPTAEFISGGEDICICGGGYMHVSQCTTEEFISGGGYMHMKRRIHACQLVPYRRVHIRRRIYAYEEEDTCMSVSALVLLLSKGTFLRRLLRICA